MGQLETEVFRTTNRQRMQHGKRSLKRSRVLDRTAKRRANQLAKEDAAGKPLAHGRWYRVIQKLSGKLFGWIAENIAEAQRTPSQVCAAWWHSDSHRANILADEATHLGVGHVYRNQKHFWVQHYGEARKSPK